MATKTIQIAPYNDQIKIIGNTISTDFAGGIAYTAQGLRQYEEESLKSCFSTAIAFTSKPWQLERLLNDALNLQGRVHNPEE